MFFFISHTAPTAIYTLSLHERSSDLGPVRAHGFQQPEGADHVGLDEGAGRVDGAVDVRLRREVHDGARPVACQQDRKSTRLNSSHVEISYAVFCLKKKN